MQQTIDFLKIIDKPFRRGKAHSQSKYQRMNQSANPILPLEPKRRNLDGYQYAKGMQFGEEKLQLFPTWLKNRPDFVELLYKDYEKKLLSLPKICQKQAQQRSSDELYFIGMYLQQIHLFDQTLNNNIKELLLKNLKVKYFKKNDVIHQTENTVPFMGIIFLGEVDYKLENGTVVKKGRNETIMNKCFYDKPFPTTFARQETILLVWYKNVYDKLKEVLRLLIDDKYKDNMDELPRSDLFTELHIKDKKSKIFMKDLEIQFYFKGENVCECGDLPEKFYILLVGKIIRQNHIYIRQHNKWPLPHGRWEIRAVYNTHQNYNDLQLYDFFGDEELISGNKLKSSYIVKEHCILLSMSKQNFFKNLQSEDQKKLKKYRNDHVVVNYPEFEKQVRKQKRSLHFKKQVIKHAIDVSFCNKTTLPQLQQTKRKIGFFEKHMMDNVTSILDDL